MDEMTLLKDAYDAAAPPTDVRLAARDRLMREIATPHQVAARQWTPRLPVLRLAVTAGAMAVVVAGASFVLLVDQDSDGTKRPSASNAEPSQQVISASRVLHLAAERSRVVAAQQKTPRSDQYIYSREVTKETYTEGGGTRMSHGVERWRPIDGSAAEGLRPVGGGVEDDTIAIIPATGPISWPPVDFSEVQKLPTDPDGLIREIKQIAGLAPDDESVFHAIVMLFSHWKILPRGLQAAGFEAIARLADASVVPDVTDAAGRKGIGITYPFRPELSYLSKMIILDAETYDYLGEAGRQPQPRTDLPELAPGDTPTSAPRFKKTGAEYDPMDPRWSESVDYVTAVEISAVVDKIGDRS